MSEAALAELNAFTADLNALNDALREAGQAAQRLNQRGFEVHMTLWDRDNPGSTVHGRLQSNCARADVRKMAQND